MGSESSLLYQHQTFSGTTPESNNATETGLFTALNRLVATGFHVGIDSDARLAVSPANRLTGTQRDWIQQHKPALVAALAAEHWRWCVEYPRWWVRPDSGTRCIVDYLPEADFRRVTADYPGAAVWPAPEDFDVVGWINEGMSS